MFEKHNLISYILVGNPLYFILFTSNLCYFTWLSRTNMLCKLCQHVIYVISTCYVSYFNIKYKLLIIIMSLLTFIALLKTSHYTRAGKDSQR